MRYSTKAWLGLGAYVGVAEWFSPQGETLSEGFDSWLLKWHTAAVAAAITGVTVAHLFNILPAQHDPIHLFFSRANQRYIRESVLRRIAKDIVVETIRGTE